MTVNRVLADNQTTIGGNFVVNGSTTFNGEVILGNGLHWSPAAGTFNDLAITGLTTSAVVYTNTLSGAITITGIAGGVDGRTLTFVNTSTNTITLAHFSTSSAAGNRLVFANGQPRVVSGNSAITFIYSGTDARWFAQTVPDAGYQAANTVLAGPVSGAAGESVFRALVAADLPASYGVAAGTNTYTATLGLSAYLTGQSLVIQFTNANTGAATFNSDSLGAKAIQLAGVALTTGQITAGASLELVYDGTQFQIVGELGGVGPAGPSNRFIIPLSDGNQSTKFDATTKRVLGQRYFDPTLAQWGTSGTSTATLYMVLQTTNGAIAVGGDLYRETGAGSPVTVATLPTTTSTTAALVSVDVSTAFKSTGTPGIFDCRFWITTANGTDQASCSGAWIEIQP